jgi:hypothetical protein
MGASRRQTAQKRHADLSRRHRLPRAADTPDPATAAAESGGTTPRRHPGGDRVPAAAPAGGAEPGPGGPAAPVGGRTPDAAAQAAAIACHPQADDLAPAPPRPASAGRPRPTAPKITAAVIAEGRYEIVKAADHAESRAWHVLVGGKRAGLVRPTWRGERGRRAWEPVTNAGNALPVTGTSRVTRAGNARDRDAAAVSLLQALRRQQEDKTASY